MRRNARVDGNHREILDALAHAGCSVQSLAPMGKGVPDALVAIDRERQVLFEIKDGSLPPSKQKLTTDEAKWHACWKGEVHIVTSVEQALAIVGQIRRGAL